MKQAISTIRDTIKSQVAESAECRKRIHESKGMDRYWAWCSKRDVGDRTRYLYLALACLRGRSYGSIEPECREGNEPSASRLHGTIVGAVPQDCPEKAEWTKERVKAWLTRPEAAQAVPVAREEAAA